MSNHGKESTNEEGVNIDEMQTKIDMGKLITLPSIQGLCPHKSNTHSVKQIFLGSGNDILVLPVATQEVGSVWGSELEIEYGASRIFGFSCFVVEKSFQYLLPEINILFTVFNYSGKVLGQLEQSRLLHRWDMVHEYKEVVDFSNKIYVLIFFFKVSASRHWDRKWSVQTSGWVMIVLDVGVNNDVRGLDFFISAGVRGCLQLESNLFGEVIDSLFSVGSDDLNEVVGCSFQVVGGYEVRAE
jgi:hypothetical protein